jgi:hypothetical protein
MAGDDVGEGGLVSGGVRVGESRFRGKADCKQSRTAYGYFRHPAIEAALLS